MVDATKVEQDGPILLGANKLLYTSSNLVLATPNRAVEFITQRNADSGGERPTYSNYFIK